MQLDAEKIIIYWFLLLCLTFNHECHPLTALLIEELKGGALLQYKLDEKAGVMFYISWHVIGCTCYRVARSWKETE